MPTKTLTHLIMGLSLSTLFLTNSVFAKSKSGSDSGGGGYAVVCRDENNIETAELLDLYEARSLYGLSLFNSTGSLEGDYILGVQNTYHLLGHDDILIDPEVRKNLYSIINSFEFIRSPKKIPSIDDISNTISIPNNCRTEQVAFFVDKQEKILINENLWDKLDSLSQAALITHEMAYYQYRKFNENTSENSRAIVAHIYSINSNPVINSRTAKLAIGLSVPKFLKKGEQVMSTFHSEQIDPRLMGN